MIGRTDTITWAHITTICCLLETYFRFKDTKRLKVKRWKYIYLKQILPKVPNLKYNMYLSEKAGLNLYIRKTKIMASGLITSWQIAGLKHRSSDRFYFLGSKITANSDCSLEIKRRLLLGRKAMINLDSILKSKDIISLTKVHIVKAFFLVIFGFLVVIYRWFF